MHLYLPGVAGGCTAHASEAHQHSPGSFINNKGMEVIQSGPHTRILMSLTASLDGKGKVVEKKTTDRKIHCHTPETCYYGNATLPLSHIFLNPDASKTEGEGGTNVFFSFFVFLFCFVFNQQAAN